jgi:hypothetical protein
LSQSASLLERECTGISLIERVGRRFVRPRGFHRALSLVSRPNTDEASLSSSLALISPLIPVHVGLRAQGLLQRPAASSGRASMGSRGSRAWSFHDALSLRLRRVLRTLRANQLLKVASSRCTACTRNLRNARVRTWRTRSRLAPGCLAGI